MKGATDPDVRGFKSPSWVFHWRDHDGGREYETPPYYF